MSNSDYLDLLQKLAPETIMVLTALAVLALDLLAMRAEPLRNRFWAAAGVAVLGCAAAACWMWLHAPTGAVPEMFVDDSLTRLVKDALLALAVCAIITALESNFTTHVGEFVSLILLAVIGMMMLVSSTNLLMIFISLELTSLSLYILAAFNKQDIKSAEAALKYFLFGGMSAAFTLYGLSLVYGLTGSTTLSEIASHLASAGKPEPLLIAAIVMTIIGFGFKVAAVPFHLWAPDAYQGAPIPSTVLIASASKVASFFVFARLLITGLAGGAVGRAGWHDFASGWAPVIAILAAASMVLGNLAAIAQLDVKRLLAYSAIAHAGYALLGLLAGNGPGVSSLVYYTVTYGLTVAGAFAVVMVVENATGGSRLSNFAGLGRREPLISFCMMVFMLSLAGIPPLAGFFGKFYLFTAAAGGAKNLGLLWLVFLAVAMSAVSLYYYLQVLKQIYVVPPGENAWVKSAPVSSRLLLVALMAGVVLLGCWPDLLVAPLLASIRAIGL